VVDVLDIIEGDGGAVSDRKLFNFFISFLIGKEVSIFLITSIHSG
jgi:hypothetical protein